MTPTTTPIAIICPPVGGVAIEHTVQFSGLAILVAILVSCYSSTYSLAMKVILSMLLTCLVFSTEA
jgi:hypothetical protein